MKKIFVLLVCLMFTWCWGSDIDNKGIEEYNNELMGIQEQAVESLRSYYEGLEKDYDGSNLITMFTWTLDELSLLKSKAEHVSWWKEDDSLKNAIVEYISWMKVAFSTYEWPVVEVLVDYTWQISHFYRDNKELFSQSAMKLAWELAVLDKTLEWEYTIFSEKYGYK